MSTKPFLRVVFVLTLGVAALLMTACGLPPISSYQGYLTTASGSPVADGTYDVTFRFYDALTGGNNLYTQTGTITVEKGLFSTDLGEEDMPTDVWANQIYLEVVIEGETLSPRQPLRGAPYAHSLTSGAVVAGNEPITRTLLGYPNAGASLLVSNAQTDAGGGSGIVGATFSSNADAAGVVGVSQAGSYGGRMSSENYRGLRTDSNNAAFYSAAFFGGIGIYVEGNCTGCRNAEIAVNVGTDAINAGDFVAVSGVEIGANGAPMLQVQRATGADDVIVGVALAQTSLSGGADAGGDTTPSGAALRVLVTGLAQVTVDPTAAVAVGDYLTAGADGAVVSAGRGAAGNAPVRVMSAIEAGKVWVMFGGQ